MDGHDFLYPCFSRADLAFERGDGAWLFTADGQRYLDCATGIAVTGLGHSHRRLVDVVTRQAAKLWHVSNAYRIPQQEQLAEKLCAATFADRVFFNNSGAEAVETAIKTARRYHHVNGRPERWRLVTFEGAFHGRTLATVAAGGQAKYLEGFGAPVDGFDQVPFGDLDALAAACGPETAGVLIEPVQGESGVRTLAEGALARIRALCDRHGLLLVLDEVQTGIGRTGHLFAYQASGVTPDILASAKGLGNGFPVAACLATEAAAAGMTPGTHGSTFGGNPLAMAVASEVLDIMLEPGFIETVRRTGEQLRIKLDDLAASYPELFECARGEGLLLGLKCRRPVREVMMAVRDQGVLSVVAGDDVLRILPPLTLSIPDAKELVVRLHAAALALSNPADIAA
ncbi:aspartate aminotransferase family protein [Sphingomonas sp. H39-1-10]|uniref:aspartate aminotransferase family protein n=1 Tax=Sphingomonadales TaxID=204457 RepID=UPI000C2021B2|nr:MULTISPECIES: aspartate aminotransferase family protein [Sphingomonadaceae]MDF0490096.1 aspartate aminotransferase family protein [Sphingomonas pollutisoli]PJG45481.1 acetylornithine transaminase [Sphingobium sp. LB126]